MSITYSVKKKENAHIIHSATKTWKYIIIRNAIILCLFSFRKFHTCLYSEPVRCPLFFSALTSSIAYLHGKVT